MYKTNLLHHLLAMTKLQFVFSPVKGNRADRNLFEPARGPLEPEERERIERIGAYIYGQYAPKYTDAGDAKDVSAGRAAR